MEPLAVLSVAANVAQLVTISAQVLCKGHRIYQSADGLLSEYHHVEQVTNRFIVMQSRLKQSLRSANAIGPLKENDQAIYDLVQASDKLADKLLEKLNAVKVHGSGRAWKSLRQALKSVWSRNEINSMAESLNDLRNLLQSRLIVSIRYVSF